MWFLCTAKEQQVQIGGFMNLHMDTGVCVCVIFFNRPGRASGDATATFSGSVCHQPIHQHFSLSSLSASKLPSDSPPIHPFIPRLPHSLYSRLKFAKCPRAVLRSSLLALNGYLRTDNARLRSVIKAGRNAMRADVGNVKVAEASEIILERRFWSL